MQTKLLLQFHLRCRNSIVNGHSWVRLAIAAHDMGHNERTVRALINHGYNKLSIN